MDGLKNVYRGLSLFFKKTIKNTHEQILSSHIKDSWSFLGGGVPYCVYMSMSYIRVTEFFKGNFTKTRLYNFYLI